MRVDLKVIQLEVNFVGVPDDILGNILVIQ